MHFLLKVFFFLLAFNYFEIELIPTNSGEDYDETKPIHDDEIESIKGEIKPIKNETEPIFNVTEIANNSESHVKFTFHALKLGHSGILISWEPVNETLYEENIKSYFGYFLKFGKQRLEKKTSVDLQFSEKVSPDSGQYKMHSLNENTSYAVIIQQSFLNGSIVRKYSTEIQTNSKTNRKPRKPQFECENGTGITFIMWFPCGKERNCHDEEPGTHFGSKIKALDTSWFSVTKTNEYQRSHQAIVFSPGQRYEVVVYSVNGESETDSDPQEIYIKPMSTPVQNVNIISMSDSSVLIDWKPPKYTLDENISEIYLIHHHESSQLYQRDPLYFPDEKGENWTLVVGYAKVPIKIKNVKSEVEYTYTIIPDHGFEYRLKHTIHLYNHELRIAQPDFRFGEVEGENEICRISLHYLPCGHSWDCKNTRPGLNCSIKIEPKTEFGLIVDEGYEGYSFLASFNTSQVYEVSIKSWIGNISSEPEIKKVKNCSLWENTN